MKFVMLMLLARIVNWTTGCGPADGQLGGKCLTDDSGCSRDGRCNEGQCDESTNTCEEPAQPSVPPVATAPPPTRTCDFGPLGACAGGQLAIVCDPYEPFPAGVRACLLQIPFDKDAGGLEYCCEPDVGARSNDASSFFAPFVDQ